MHAPFPRVLGRLLLATGLAFAAPLAWADKGGHGPGGPGDKPGKSSPGPAGKSARPGKPKYPPGQNAEWKAWQTSKAWKKHGGWPGAAHWDDGGAKNWQAERRSWGHRGGYGGYVIPAAQYEARFGPRRAFRIRSRPVMHQGYARFSHGGYSFLMVDPYPASWGPGWYATDEVAVVNNGGYYLVNRKHPGNPIAVMVVN